ncbi:MAG: universal stress protein [Magnetococcales bacterium]|nr:universal stress protein [Magnetococcales bacterium]
MHAQLSPGQRFERILLATEGSNFSQGADRVAMDMATLCHAEILAMTMVANNDEYAALAPERLRQDECAAWAHLSAVREQGERRGLNCTIRVCHGVEPADAILKVAHEACADLVVMGRRGRRGLWSRLLIGQATSMVVGQASRKVLVVPQNAGIWRQRILLAIDGSRHGDAAAATALRLARVGGVPLSVLTVIRSNHAAERRAMAEQAVDRVARFARQEGVVVEGWVEAGDPAAVVIETAGRLEADLIVGGGFGHTHLRDRILGGVIERIIGNASCPVLVVNG